MKKQGNRDKTQSVVIRNERLTVWAGAIIFLIVIVELVVTANLNQFLSLHIFVGVLLTGPIVVKMSSVGYRFFGYYTKNPDFVEKGPPIFWLRLSAPFLVILTVLVFISGFGLVVVGPAHAGLFKVIHAGSVILWLPLLAIHIWGNFNKVKQSVTGDWRHTVKAQVQDRFRRFRLNTLGLLLGVMAALILYPSSTTWYHVRINHGLPGVLVAGIFAAVVAIVIAKPLLAKESQKKM